MNPSIIRRILTATIFKKIPYLQQEWDQNLDERNTIIQAGKELFLEKEYATITSAMIAIRTGLPNDTIEERWGGKSGVYILSVARYAHEGLCVDEIPVDFEKGSQLLLNRIFSQVMPYDPLIYNLRSSLPQAMADDEILEKSFGRIRQQMVQYALQLFSAAELELQLRDELLREPSAWLLANMLMYPNNFVANPSKVTEKTFQERRQGLIQLVHHGIFDPQREIAVG